MAEGEGSPVPVRPPVPRPPVPRHPSAEDGSQRRGFPGQREPRGVQGIRGGPTGAIQELLEELLLRGEAEGTPGDAPELVRRDTEGHTQGDTPWGRGDEGSAVNSDARVVDATPSQTEAGPATALKERQVGSPQVTLALRYLALASCALAQQWYIRSPLAVALFLSVSPSLWSLA